MQYNESNGRSAIGSVYENAATFSGNYLEDLTTKYSV